MFPVVALTGSMWISLLVSNVSLLNKLFSQKNILKKSNCFVFALKSERKECLGVVTAFSPESVGVDLTIVYIFCF